MLREAIAMVVIGVVLALGSAVPLAQDLDGRINDTAALVLFYGTFIGGLLTGLGALMFWLEVLR